MNFIMYMLTLDPIMIVIDGGNNQSALHPSSDQVIPHMVGVRLRGPKPVLSEDKLPAITASNFVDEIMGQLNISETPYQPHGMSLGSERAASDTVATPTSPPPTFQSVQEAWTKKDRKVNLAQALETFATAVADQPAFGTQGKPGMNPNKGWGDLQSCCAPPSEYIRRIGEYYAQPPTVM
jgi:hypothetical protein